MATQSPSPLDPRLSSEYRYAGPGVEHKENVDWVAGYNAILEWAQLPTSRDKATILALYADHHQKRAQHEPGSSHWMREAGVMEGLARTYRENFGGEIAGDEHERHNNARRPTALSDSLKKGASIGPTENWRTIQDAIDGAMSAARQDLASKGITSPDVYELQKHARAKLQARININAKKLAGKSKPRWFDLMEKALADLKANKPPKPKRARQRHLFPRRSSWDTGKKAASAARRVARQQGAKTRADVDASAARLLGDVVAAEPGESQRAWHKSAMIALHQLQKIVAKRTEKKLPKARGRKKNIGLTPSDQSDRDREASAAAEEAQVDAIPDGTQPWVREQFREALRGDPLTLARSVQMMLDGRIGSNGQHRARTVIAKYSQRPDALAGAMIQALGVFNWGVSRLNSAAEWGLLTRAQRQAIAAKISELLAYRQSESQSTDAEIAEDLRKFARGENPCTAALHRLENTSLKAIVEDAAAVTKDASELSAHIRKLAKKGAISPKEADDMLARVEAALLRLRSALPRKANGSPARIEQLAEEFVNGGKPAGERLPLTRKKVEIVVFPKEAFDVGILHAFEYLKDRPGVDGKFFIHRIEVAPKDRPVVFIERTGEIQITPSPEKWANRKGATAPAMVEVVGPAVKTKIRQDELEVADGGTVTKLWIKLPSGIEDTRGKIVPFNIWELTFPANSRPVLDFDDRTVTMNFTRTAWNALPASQRVFWQYVGRKPTTREGHGF